MWHLLVICMITVWITTVQKRFAEAMKESNKSSYPSRPDIDMRKELERSEQLLVEHKPEQFRCRG